ncbi:glutathione hydrolase 1 proenzyme isoform X2 [Exaiptasia diaphana]|nr:glutathione hydrolase 1 proenzyme isoform X2 [Exaiptasia diaphana]
MTSHTKHFPSKQHHYSKAAVATDNEHCSKIGRDILIKGGSAVDSAIASMLCVGVINMHSTGIGGGGFMLVYDPFRKKAEMIDFRETAPIQANRDMFQGDAKNGIQGGLAVAVPGELRGMEKAWKMYGRLKWKDLFLPSIKLAKDGFPMPETVNIAVQLWKKTLKKDKCFRKAFIHDGKLLKTGDIIKRPKLAKVLTIIANAGSSRPFYDGSLSKTIVSDVKHAGGRLTLSDLKSYKVKVKPALKSNLGSHTLLTGPAPTAGPVLAMIINMLSGYHFKPSDLKKHPVRTYHRIIETFKFAYKYRSMLGDPDYEKTVGTIVKEMMNENIAKKLRHMIWDNQTHTQNYYGKRYHVPLKTGTTHLSILSEDGQAVSVTSTVNGYFGAKFMSCGLGFVYNNEMDDFSAPGITNEFGLLPSPVNFIKPGKRPQSSAVPAIILDKDSHVNMVVGGAGGTIITTAVANVIMNYFWFKNNIKNAVSRARVHDQLYPESVFAETWFPPEVVNGLRALGHKVDVSDTSHGVVQAVVKNPIRFTANDLTKGKRKGYVHRFMSQVFAESDYRKGGLPAGY